MRDVVSTTEEAAPARRGDRGSGATAIAAGAATRSPCRAIVGLNPVPELRRRRLHRDQADGIERIDRRAIDVARLGLLRPRGAARDGDPCLGEGERRLEARRRRRLADRRLLALLPMASVATRTRQGISPITGSFSLPSHDNSARWPFRVKLLDHRCAAAQRGALIDRALIGQFAAVERRRIVHQNQASQAARSCRPPSR